MKKTIQQYIYTLGLSLVALALLLLCLKSVPQPGTAPAEESAPTPKSLPEQLLRLQVGEDRALSLWMQEEGCYYAFLPSYAEHVSLVLEAGTQASLNGAALYSGMDLGAFETNTAYPLTLNGEAAGTLCFLRSANLPALYIETESGSLDNIHANKNNEETSSVTLVSPEGAEEYAAGGCLLKGRGNMTWLLDKRAYLLTLPQETGLLGMGAATKWVLLANALDDTGLRNKLIFDLAGESDFAWTPGCEYVDVYINGEYRGLYLLTEKVESGPNRLNLNEQAGDFLCRLDLDERWSDLRYPFRTPYGRTVEISDPKQLTTGSRENVGARTAELEERILSGEDLTQAEDFDLDSWVRRYLIDEISGNIDADLASSYFYCQDGVFYGGPVWDYDMTLGNSPRNRDPRAFIANTGHVSSVMESPYVEALYRNPGFRQRVEELYEQEFRPILAELVDGGIRERAEAIRDASAMNNLRWDYVFREYYDNGSIYATDAEFLEEYLRTRMDFLDSAWIRDVEYCTVQLEYAPGGFFWNVTVEKGTPLKNTVEDVTEYTWYDYWTGEFVGPDTAITGDRILTVRFDPQKELTAVSLAKLSLVFFGGLMICLLAADGLLRRKERSKADDKTHVSP